MRVPHDGVIRLASWQGLAGPGRWIEPSAIGSPSTVATKLTQVVVELVVAEATYSTTH